MLKSPSVVSPLALAWAFSLLALTTQPLTGQTTLIHAGGVLDPTLGEVVSEQTLTIENGRIRAITPGYTRAAEGQEVHDLSSYIVLPGLMDMHVHLTMEQSGPAGYLARLSDNPADAAIAGVEYARRTLEAGFTTVRELGSETTSIVALRAAINRGDLAGPRIFAATASLASTGGHGDRSNGLSAALRGDPGPAQGIVNSVEDARKAVRQRYKEGADLIKITATGGVLSLAKNGQNPQFSEEEIRAITSTAADYGFMVAAHAHGKEGAERAIRGGVTTIEHGTYLDNESFALMKEHGTYLVPTILAGRFVAEKAQIDGYFPEIVRPKAATIGPLIEGMFEGALSAGVNVAFGTDCGVCPHGSNAREFELMVGAGMSEIDAIRSATTVTAQLLGLDRAGRVAEGFEADLIAVPNNPLNDIRTLQEVAFVMRAGRVYLQP